MKKLFQTLRAAGLALLLTVPGFAQTLPFDWAVTCASGEGIYKWGPEQLLVDGQGNTYVRGRFNGTTTLGSTTLTATRIPAGMTGVSDEFIAKLDVAGNYLWATQLGDNQVAYANSLALDAAGNAYIAGSFNSHSMRFGTSELTLYNSSAGSEGFVAKLDGATGQFLWARRAGGTGGDGLKVESVSATGEVLLTGGTNSPDASFGPFTLDAAGRYVSLLARLSTAGTWLSVQPLDGIGGNVQYMSLLPEAGGAVYVYGVFSAPSASFGPFTLTTQGIPGSHYANDGKELFIAKRSAAGQWLWAVQGDAVTRQNLIEGTSNLFNDGQGHLYLGGQYASTSARFGATVLPNRSAMNPPPIGPAPPRPITNNYANDVFVARLSAETGAWDWAVRNGGPEYETANYIGADAQSRIYILGHFDSMLPAGGKDQFIRLDATTGAWNPVQKLSMTGVSFAFDAQNRLYLAGSFYAPTASFGTLTLAQAGPGLRTGYVARISASILAGKPATPPAPALEVWPNPSGAARTVWVRGPKAGQPVEVLDVLGRRLVRAQMPGSGTLRLPLPAALPTGVYVVRGGGQARRLVVE